MAINPETEGTRRESPPYISFRSFLNLLDRLEHGGIPQRIDRSYWGGIFSGGYGPQVIATLRYFKLLDEHDEPTPTLHRLVERDRKATLADLLLEHYGPIILGIDLKRATVGQLDTAFRDYYKLAGDTLRKARVFFVHAAKYAEIPLSSHVTSQTRTRRNGKVVKKTQPGRSSTPLQDESSDVDVSESANNQPRDTETIQLRSGNGAVTLSFALNWFTAEQRERDFVLDLIDKIRAYQRQAVTRTAEPPSDALPTGEPPDSVYGDWFPEEELEFEH